MSDLTVAELTGNNKDLRRGELSDELVISNCFVGVEIELEEYKINELTFGRECPHWEVKEDHSLRGSDAHELVFSYPYSGQDVVDAIDEVETFTVKHKLHPDCSLRTSLHVHLDVRDMQVESLLRFIAAYAAIEPLLYHYCDESRRNNIFCLSLKDAEHPLHVMTMLHSVIKKENLTKDQIVKTRAVMKRELNRYSGFNLNSAFIHGSAEFRMHQGEWRKKPILEWINILLCIKKYAQKARINPYKLPEHASTMGLLPFVVGIFGPFSKKLLYAGWEKDVLVGIRLGQDLLYSEELASASSKLFDEIYTTSRKDDLFTKYQQEN